MEYDSTGAPITWERFQAASPHSQGSMAVKLLYNAANLMGFNHENPECVYVKRGFDPQTYEPEPVTALQPVCAIGWALFHIDGYPAGFASRDEFLTYLERSSSLNPAMAKVLGLKPTTMLAWSAAQQAADCHMSWQDAARMADRIYGLSTRYIDED